MTQVMARVHPVHLMNADWAPGGRQPSDQASRLGLSLLKIGSSSAEGKCSVTTHAFRRPRRLSAASVRAHYKNRISLLRSWLHAAHMNGASVRPSVLLSVCLSVCHMLQIVRKRSKRRDQPINADWGLDFSYRWSLYHCVIIYVIFAFPMLLYKYIFQIRYTEAILSNSTRKLLWVENSRKLITI